MRWRIESLEAKGFRGIRAPIALTFSPSATVIVAPNGTGKTSILGAVEWCLFGELPFQPSEGPLRGEIINALSPEHTAQVTLVLRDGARSLHIQRTKTLGERGSSVVVHDDSGQSFKDLDAEERLFRVLGITAESFVRAVYLHQESVRGLLLDEPKVRNDALDRLFGVDKLRDFLGGLATKPIKDRANEVEHRKQKALERIAGQLEGIEDSRSRALAEVRRASVSDEELNLAAAVEMTRKVTTQVAEVAARLGIHSSFSPVPDDIESLDKVSKEVTRAIREIRKAATDLGSGKDISGQLVKLEVAATKLKEAGGKQRERQEELLRAEEAYGTQEALTAELARLEARVVDLARVGDGLANKERVLSDTILFLESQPEASECPACGRPIDPKRLKREIKVRLGEEIKSRLVELSKERRTAERLAAEHRQRLSVLQELNRRRDETASDEQEARKAVVEALNLSEDPSDGLLGLVEESRTALVGRLEEISEDGQRREADLERIEALHERVKAVIKYLSTIHQLNEASANRGQLADEDSETNLQLDKLAGLLNSVEAIGRAVTEVANTRANDALAAAQGGISDYYRRLCGHPYFDNLHVEVGSQRVRGQERNNYLVNTVSTADAYRSLAKARLSTAQMNCVALSIYLALATRLDHGLGFLILDDPSQSLDTGHKAALAALLTDLSGVVQLIVATEDEEMGDLLRSALGAGNSVMKSLDWAPSTGTVLEDLSA